MSNTNNKISAPGRIEKNLSEGSVFKNLVLFAIPFLISNAVQSLYNVADMLIVGRFAGTDAMSGVFIGGQITFILTHTVIGLSMGGTVLIGQCIGEGNRKELKRIIQTVITLLVVIALVVTPLILFLRDPILRLMQTSRESFADSSDYLVVTSAGIIFIFGYNALSAILRGMGNSKQPLYFVLAACIVNIGLDLLLVAVFDMGAKGAAIATVVSQAISVLLCVIYMRRNNFPFDFLPRSYKLHREQLRRIVKIGLPTMTQNGIISFSFLFLTAMINIIGGSTAAAAVGAVSRFNTFALMPVIAIAQSVSAICAQNFGAGRLDRVVRTTKIGLWMAIAASFTFFIICRLWPGSIIALFDDSPEVVSAGALYLTAMSSDFLIIPFTFCLNALFISGGHTLFTMTNSIFASIILRMPAIWFLGIHLDMGLRGAGYAVPIATGGSCVIIFIFLATGKWKKNKTRAGEAATEIG